MAFSSVIHRPKVQIDIHARDLLEQKPGLDGLTELDHIILGALLVSTPPLDDKHKSAATNWANEEELQVLLWSYLDGASRGETLPLYAANSRTGSVDLPPYTSLAHV